MTTILKVLFFFAFILVLAFGFSWLADRPGEISVIWEGQQYQTGLIVAVTALVVLVAVVMVFWWLLRTLWTSPHSVRRFFRPASATAAIRRFRPGSSPQAPATPFSQDV